MTVTEALALGAARLRAAGIEGAARDARRLLAGAMGVAAGRLGAMGPEAVPAAAERRFGEMLEARAARRPVARILGRRAFWGRDFAVTDAVLDPRPETEVLLAAALEEPARRLLDLGTGSGILAVSLLAEWPGARGVATDISAAALEVARRNAAAHGVAGRLELLESDWFARVAGRFDLIVSNPPYIAAAELPALAPEVRRHDPPEALSPGGDGLGAYRAIAAGARGHLRPGGRLLVEIGPAQAAAVAALFSAAGLEGVAVRPDLDGRERVVMAKAPE
jgi:release factor glutamine methyltransferase